MVLSLLPVTFRIILVAASCGEVIAACSYEAVAKLRSDVVTWSWGVPKPQLDPTVGKSEKNETWHQKAEFEAFGYLKWGVSIDMLDGQWCFSEPPNRGQKLLGHEKIGRSMVWTDPWSSYPHQSRKDQGQMEGFWVMGWWLMRLDYRNLYLKHPIVYKMYVNMLRCICKKYSETRLRTFWMVEQEVVLKIEQSFLYHSPAFFGLEGVLNFAWEKMKTTGQ